MAQEFRPKSDQPKVTAKEIARGPNVPAIDYRSSGIKSYASRSMGRDMSRMERR